MFSCVVCRPRKFDAVLGGLCHTYGAQDSIVLDHYFSGVQIEDAIEITKDYEKFIKVMLDGNNGSKLQAQWDVEHEVITYVHYHPVEGKLIVSDRVVAPRWVDAEGNNEWLLEWINVSITPKQRIHKCRSSWKLIRRNNGTRLQWIRYFEKPYLFGLFDLSSSIKEYLIASGGHSIHAFSLYYNAIYPSRLPKYTDKVLIIGGGPSGIHMAHMLIKRGYDSNNILIVEKNPVKPFVKECADNHQNDTYGKTFSIFNATSEKIVESNPKLNIKKVTHELGTCYLHPAYFAVRELFKELQANSNEKDMFEEVGPDSYIVRKPGSLLRRIILIGCERIDIHMHLFIYRLYCNSNMYNIHFFFLSMLR